MPTRNIYFTTDQVVEMQKFPCNWSKVCQEAVDQKLKEMEQQYKKLQQYEEINAALL